jgi:hypothetical protein
MKILLLPKNNSLSWFRSPQVINDCIRAELALMKKLKPDL